MFALSNPTMRCFVAVLLLTLVGCSLQLKVAIYYEANDHNSKSTLVHSIQPGYNKLSGEVDFDFDFIPYGRSSQQTENNVRANRIQACVFNEDQNNTNKLGFLGCAAQQDDASSLFYMKTCIKYWGFDYDLFQVCYEGSLGDQVTEQNKEKTEKIIPTLTATVPALTYNDKFDEAESSAACLNFFYETCVVLDQKPAICAESR